MEDGTARRRNGEGPCAGGEGEKRREREGGKEGEGEREREKLSNKAIPLWWPGVI